MCCVVLRKLQTFLAGGVIYTFTVEDDMYYYLGVVVRLGDEPPPQLLQMVYFQEPVRETLICNE